MMNVLKDEGYIVKEKYGAIVLTDNGRIVADYVRKRHDLLKSFLIDVLGVDEAIAKNDACHMEHDISIETTEKLYQQLESLLKCTKN